MEEIKRIPQRSEIAAEDKWATEDRYPSDEAWEAELATIAADQEKAAAFAGTLGSGAAQLIGGGIIKSDTLFHLDPAYLHAENGARLAVRSDQRLIHLKSHIALKIRIRLRITPGKRAGKRQKKEGK